MLNTLKLYGGDAHAGFSKSNQKPSSISMSYSRGIWKKFGIVKSTVSLYESGKSSPNDEIKKKICDYFDVTIDYLVGFFFHLVS